MLGRIAVLVVGLAIGLGVAACGGDDEAGTDTTTTTDTTTEDALVAGKAVFLERCGSCHTLSDAGTTGSIGPALDGSGLTSDAVETQVRNGGGAMPAFEGDLSEEEIQNVSAYVADASGG